MTGGVKLHEKDAAVSLCAMSQSDSSAQAQQDFQTVQISSSLSTIDFQQSHVVEDDQSKAPDCVSVNSLSDQRRPSGLLPMKKRMVVKRKLETKRDPRVSFEEMKRLIRVYGPTKCL
eukprot:890168_1